MGFLDSLMYSRTLRNNPAFAQMEQDRMQTALKQQQRDAELQRQRDLINELNPQGIAPDVLGEAGQQQIANLMLGGLSRDVVAPTYAQGYTGSYMPQQPNQTDFDKQWAIYQQQNPNATLPGFWAAQNQGKGTKITVGNTLRDFGEQALLDTFKAGNKYHIGRSQGAEDIIENSEVGMDLLFSSSTEPGAWEPLKAEISKYLDIAPDLVTDAETWNTLTNQFALDKLQAFKGPTTDFEFEIVQSMSPELKKSAQGNYINLLMMQRAAQKKQMMPSYYQEWIQEKTADRSVEPFHKWVKPRVEEDFPRMSVEDMKEDYIRRKYPARYNKMKQRFPDARVKMDSDNRLYVEQ